MTDIVIKDIRDQKGSFENLVTGSGGFSTSENCLIIRDIKKRSTEETFIAGTAGYANPQNHISDNLIVIFYGFSGVQKKGNSHG